jgi:hypothetical protein
MKKILKFTAFSAVLLALAGGLASCDRDYKEECEDPPFGIFGLRLQTVVIC